MIRSGNATVFVSDFEEALTFYTEVLGLTLRMRAENYWAEVVAGSDLVIGIHPANEKHQAPGTRGAIELGLTIEGRMETVVEHLKAKGVKFTGPILEDAGGALRFQYLEDPDGNVLYLWENALADASA